MEESLLIDFPWLESWSLIVFPHLNPALAAAPDLTASPSLLVHSSAEQSLGVQMCQMTLFLMRQWLGTLRILAQLDSHDWGTQHRPGALAAHSVLSTLLSITSLETAEQQVCC